MSWVSTAGDMLALLGCIELYVEHRVRRWCNYQDHLPYFNLGYFGASRLLNLTGSMISDGHLQLGGEGFYHRRTRRHLESCN
ncbi:hypothetical protein PIB30_027388 [Stylosanthes scabra]|uniref:Uncharacterized protein n=1 Tax=Stylosanthes scabra TaxID=79078 RepID=A0ABU6UAG8_9FABA|nr:hypothetical protein [Stylosanthes scabra]